MSQSTTRSARRFVLKLVIVLVGLLLGYLAYFRLAMSDYWLVGYGMIYLATPVVAVAVVAFMRK